MCGEDYRPNWIDTGTMCRDRSNTPEPTGLGTDRYPADTSIAGPLQHVDSCVDDDEDMDSRVDSGWEGEFSCENIPPAPPPQTTYSLHVYQLARAYHRTNSIVGRRTVTQHVNAAVRIWRSAGVLLTPIYHQMIGSTETTELLGANNSLDEGDGAAYRIRLQQSDEMSRLSRYKHHSRDLAVFFVNFPGDGKADPRRHQVYVNSDPPLTYGSNPVGRTVAHELGHVFLNIYAIARSARSRSRHPHRHSNFDSGLMSNPPGNTSIDEDEAEAACRWVRQNLTSRP